MSFEVPSEENEQIALVEWVAYFTQVGKYLIHIPNEGKRSWCQGKKQKKLGLTAGVSDLFLAYPVFPWHGFWIEMKSGSQQGKKIPLLQEEWLKSMHGLGYKTMVAFGWIEAAKAIAEYLNLDISGMF